MKPKFSFFMLVFLLCFSPLNYSQIKNLASMKGTWTGQWVNNHYLTNGNITVDISVNLVNNTAHGDWDVGGNILGQPRLPFSTDITLTDSGFTASFTSAIWGDISGSGLYTGAYSGTAVNCPNPNATSIAAVGSFNNKEINGTFTFIWYGTLINGTVKITKQNPINDPTNLILTENPPGTINLTWDDNASNEDGYRIEKKDPVTGKWAQIAAVGKDSTAYSDNNVIPDTVYTYRVAAFNSSTESEYSQEAKLKTVIPVDLIYFSYDLNDKDVVLKWITATETNNSGFEIHRKLENLTWQKIGFVRGKGTTTKKSAYQFKDEIGNIPLTGIIKYRLNQIDYDGTINYSRVIEMNFDKILTGYSVSQNFPNPFNPVTTINYQLPVNGYVTLKIFDIFGNKIKTLINGYKSAGIYSIKFDASELASGVYLYSLRAGNFESIKKLVLLK